MPTGYVARGVVSAPELGVEKTETVPSNWLATYKKFPERLTATATGRVLFCAEPDAVMNGEPGVGLKVVPEMLNTEIVPDFGLHWMP
jgi:hypothetical protein